MITQCIYFRTAKGNPCFTAAQPSDVRCWHAVVGHLVIEGDPANGERNQDRVVRDPICQDHLGHRGMSSTVAKVHFEALR